MNKREKVEFLQETEKYIEEKQLSELFEKLTKDLVIS